MKATRRTTTAHVVLAMMMLGIPTAFAKEPANPEEEPLKDRSETASREAEPVEDSSRRAGQDARRQGAAAVLPD